MGPPPLPAFGFSVADGCAPAEPPAPFTSDAHPGAQLLVAGWGPVWGPLEPGPGLGGFSAVGSLDVLEAVIDGCSETL
ncbi:MAG TPA: hypothetical protein VHM70_17335 [Polyangiaceae bacterium]|nr:hypothetical protein [Polyangiaceae bacterium]